MYVSKNDKKVTMYVCMYVCTSPPAEQPLIITCDAEAMPADSKLRITASLLT